jgi:hypothetical protein
MSVCACVYVFVCLYLCVYDYSCTFGTTINYGLYIWICIYIVIVASCHLNNFLNVLFQEEEHIGDVYQDEANLAAMLVPMPSNHFSWSHTLSGMYHKHIK